VLKEFNQAVIKELRDSGTFVEPKDQKLDELIKRGKSLRSEPRIKKILRAAKFATIFTAFLAPIVKSATAMDAINSSKALERAYQNVQEGNYSAATNNLVSEKAGSLMDVIRTEDLVDGRIQPLIEVKLREIMGQMKAWEDEFYAE
jgi:hypothetical protein